MTSGRFVDANPAGWYNPSLDCCRNSLPGDTMSSAGHIALRGVRVHNLKSIDLDIPHRKLVVLCGLSGSGKSSLALDTLYAEGQRRYIESFSAYTRQFLQRLEKPEAERIDGIPARYRRDQQEREPVEPIDRRHGHRDQRLFAAAVCQDRPRFLPQVWAGSAMRQPAKRRRDLDEASRRQPLHDRLPLASCPTAAPSKHWPPAFARTVLSEPSSMVS